MAHINSSPFHPSIRLTPAKTRRQPRSPSRSPERKSHFSYHVLDPLLTNLSPESTLQALTSVDAVPRNEKVAQDLLAKSISKVSTDERALGIRAAVAAQKLKEWYKEILAWQWPKRTDAQLGKGFVPPTAVEGRAGLNTSRSSTSETPSEVEYLGSLPADVVQRYDTRIEEIRDGMDSLDVEELKEHVLNAHIPARSRPSSSTSTISVGPPVLSYVQLSDFTAVITATILRLLPTLSRLNILLTTWDIRLLVLRQIPGLLSGLESTRLAMDCSIAALKSTGPPKESDALFSRDTFHVKQAQLEGMVVSVGRRMDRVLDALEGREDSLPEVWIDDLETIEADFGTWAVEAEKRAVINELTRLTRRAEEHDRNVPEPKVITDDRVAGSDNSAPEVRKVPEPQLVSNDESENPEGPDSDVREVKAIQHVADKIQNLPESVPQTGDASEGYEEVNMELPDEELRPTPESPMNSGLLDEPKQGVTAVQNISIPSSQEDESGSSATGPRSCAGSDSPDLGREVVSNDVDVEIKSQELSDQESGSSRSELQMAFDTEVQPSLRRDVDPGIGPEESIDNQTTSSILDTPTALDTGVQRSSKSDVHVQAISEESLDEEIPSSALEIQTALEIESQSSVQSDADVHTRSQEPIGEESKSSTSEPQTALETEVQHPKSDVGVETISEASLDEESTSCTPQTQKATDTEVQLSSKLDVAGSQEPPLPGTLVVSTADDSRNLPSDKKNEDISLPDALMSHRNTPFNSIPKDEPEDSLRETQSDTSEENEEFVKHVEHPTDTPCEPGVLSPRPVDAVVSEVDSPSSVQQSSAMPENLEPLPHDNPNDKGEFSPADCAEDAPTIDYDCQDRVPISNNDFWGHMVTHVPTGSERIPGSPVPLDTSTDKGGKSPKPINPGTPGSPDIVDSSSRSFLSDRQVHELSQHKNQDGIRMVTGDKDLVEHTNVDEECSPKLTLESPIKITKLRPKPLNLSKSAPKPHRRHLSDVSAADSPVSDYPSLMSSPEIREAYISSPHRTPLIVETPTPLQSDYPSTGHARTNSENTLRQEQSFRFESHPRSSRPVFKHCRTASLPLQRFINEDVDTDYDEDSFVADGIQRLRRTPSASPEKSSNNEVRIIRKRSVSPLSDARRGSAATQHSTSSFMEVSTPGTSTRDELPIQQDVSRISKYSYSPQNAGQSSHSSAPRIPPRSSKRLSSHPTVTDVGSNETHLEAPVAGPTLPSVRTESRPPTSLLSKSAEDDLEEKISSILTTIPARIRLAHAPTVDEPSLSPSVPSHRNDRLGSVSPRWTPSRSSTPTPSLYLTPAYSRSRRSHSHASEESSVRLYHLHKGGKTAPPTKLFVRSVGEGGERVMVRVGGGWADLGEYLREYAIHHGHRKVSEAPKVEVQGLPSHGSPAFSSPGSVLTPATNNGRTTPSRPSSVLSSRPPSSLAVRKSRQPTAPATEGPELTAANIQRAVEPVSPMSNVSSRHRRLSISSTNSVSVASTAGDSPFASSLYSTTANPHATPLGLAGPTPRSRRVSMTPESEAWVEDVIGQAKLNSSLKPPKLGGPRTGRESSLGKRPSEPKLRSVSDIGTVGLNKRVLLRGLDRSRRESSQE